MCGRFTRFYTWRQLHDLLDLAYPTPGEMAPSWNVAPTQRSPVCRLAPDGSRELASMRWGFTPSWSKDGKPGPINARAETVATNGMFRAAYRSRRCLVPISGFYEWRATETGKQPSYIHLLNEEIICLAGLWERWGSGEGATESFTIITTEPNEAVAQIHNRMPVIVPPSDHTRWLAGPNADGLMRPYPAEEMAIHAVSRRVNSPREDDSSLISGMH